MAKPPRERKPRKETSRRETHQEEGPPPPPGRPFKMEYANGAQKLAWEVLDQHDIVFLVGPAGAPSRKAINRMNVYRWLFMFLISRCFNSITILNFVPGWDSILARWWE